MRQPRSGRRVVSFDFGVDGQNDKTLRKNENRAARMKKVHELHDLIATEMNRILLQYEFPDMGAMDDLRDTMSLWSGDEDMVTIASAVASALACVPNAKFMSITKVSALLASLQDVSKLIHSHDPQYASGWDNALIFLDTRIYKELSQACDKYEQDRKAMQNKMTGMTDMESQV